MSTCRFLGRARSRPDEHREAPSLPEPDHAWKTLALVNDWIRHSDAKAGVTLAFIGVLATMTYNLADGFEPRTLLFDLIVVLDCLMLLVAAGFCGWTLIPRVKASGTASMAINLLYFGSIANHFKGKLSGYVQALTAISADPDALVRDIAAQVHANAQIAAIKTTAARRAIVATFGAAALVLALATTVSVSS